MECPSVGRPSVPYFVFQNRAQVFGIVDQRVLREDNSDNDDERRRIAWSPLSVRYYSFFQIPFLSHFSFSIFPSSLSFDKWFVYPLKHSAHTLSFPQISAKDLKTDKRIWFARDFFFPQLEREVLQSEPKTTAAAISLLQTTRDRGQKSSVFTSKRYSETHNTRKRCTYFQEKNVV